MHGFARICGGAGNARVRDLRVFAGKSCFESFCRRINLPRRSLRAALTPTQALAHLTRTSDSVHATTAHIALSTECSRSCEKCGSSSYPRSPCGGKRLRTAATMATAKAARAFSHLGEKETPHRTRERAASPERIHPQDVQDSGLGTAVVFFWELLRGVGCLSDGTL